MPKCKYGALIENGYTPTGTQSEIATNLGIGYKTVGRHTRKNCTCYGVKQPSSAVYTKGKTASAVAGGAKNATGESETHNPDGSSNYTRFSEQPWGHDDYRAFIASKGQDPDKVTFSWGWTSNATGSGFWNKLNNVRPIAETEAGLVNYVDLADSVRKISLTPTPRGTEPTTYVVGLADFQLGKGEGDGTPGTVKRINQSLANIVVDIIRLRELGQLPKTVLLANMGDHTEGVHSSYANQSYTADLNVRDQINLALEINLLWIKTLAPYFEEVIYSACLCNHGQLSRVGGKTNVSDDADNATGLIGDTLKTLCALHPDLKHVKFEIPKDEMITTVNVSGVNLALAHGHKISGAEPAWLAKQSANLVHRKKFIVDLWFTAHKHHASLVDLGPYTRIQATTSDPGSKYYEDLSGQYSRSGVTVFITGKEIPGNWEHYRVL